MNARLASGHVLAHGLTLFSLAIGSALLHTVLFWLLTALVIWGFVDLLVTPSGRFESAHQPLAMWVLAFAFFGPAASLAWLVIRKKVRNAPPGPPWAGRPAPPYPVEPMPYVPPHLHPPTPDDGHPPPLR